MIEIHSWLSSTQWGNTLVSLHQDWDLNPISSSVCVDLSCFLHVHADFLGVFQLPPTVHSHASRWIIAVSHLPVVCECLPCDEAACYPGFLCSVHSGTVGPAQDKYNKYKWISAFLRVAVTVPFRGFELEDSLPNLTQSLPGREFPHSVPAAPSLAGNGTEMTHAAAKTN